MHDNNFESLYDELPINLYAYSVYYCYSSIGNDYLYCNIKVYSKMCICVGTFNSRIQYETRREEESVNNAGDYMETQWGSFGQ